MLPVRPPTPSCTQYNDICWRGAPTDVADLPKVFPAVDLRFGGDAVLHLTPMRYLFVMSAGGWRLGWGGPAQRQLVCARVRACMPSIGARAWMLQTLTLTPRLLPPPPAPLGLPPISLLAAGRRLLLPGRL